MSEQDSRKNEWWVSEISQRTDAEIKALEFILERTGYAPVPELPDKDLIDSFSGVVPNVPKPPNMPEVGKDRKISLFRMVKPEDLE